MIIVVMLANNKVCEISVVLFSKINCSLVPLEYTL